MGGEAHSNRNCKQPLISLVFFLRTLKHVCGSGLPKALGPADRKAIPWESMVPDRTYKAVPVVHSMDSCMTIRIGEQLAISVKYLKIIAATEH